MDAINTARLRVWAQQPDAFRDQAILDADGTIVETDAECKQGVDISYDRRWGYHPLLISLANTAEPLFLLNRSGNRPSQERAGEYLNKAVALCIRADFRKILLRGDTRIAENKDLDLWDDRVLPRDGTTIAETGTSASSSDMRPTTSSRPGPTNSRTRRTISWNDRRATRSRQGPAGHPNGSSRRSSGSEGSRRSICSRR
jgi:hypothetical protein